MAKYKAFELTAEEQAALDEVLVASGSNQEEVSIANVRQLATALQTPLRQGVLSGDILGNIFQVQKLAPGTSSEWPLDLLAPGTEKQHIAYTIPNQGYIPQRNVEGDYVTIPQYDIANAIDWNLKYAREAKWGVVQRAAGRHPPTEDQPRPAAGSPRTVEGAGRQDAPEIAGRPRPPAWPCVVPAPVRAPAAAKRACARTKPDPI